MTLDWRRNLSTLEETPKAKGEKRESNLNPGGVRPTFLPLSPVRVTIISKTVFAFVLQKRESARYFFEVNTAMLAQ